MKNKKKNLLLILFLFIAASFILFSIKNIKKTYTKTFVDYFDTVTDITVYSNNETSLLKCEEYIKKMDHELSADDKNGLIYRFNHGENVSFCSDTVELIDYAENFTKENPLFFSVYLDPLIKAWDIKNNKGYIPDVDTALSECEIMNTINLGGIAKGYITEKLVDILEKDKISSALINLGGNAYALGRKPNGEKWNIGIQDPKNENDIIGIVSAEDIAVITSGDYQRYFELNGIRYHHIYDPETGYPAANGLHSVTVISDDPTLCDALSTAVFVAGPDKGNELLKKYNCSGIFVTDDTVYISKALEDIFKQASASYRFEIIN